MALFENCSVLLELKYLSYKEKKKLRSAVTDNGGNVVFVVTKQVRDPRRRRSLFCCSLHPPPHPPHPHSLCMCFCLRFPQCSLVVTSDVANLSSNRLRSIHKHQIPVVTVDYVYSCVERGLRLPVDEFKLDISSSSSLPSPFSSPRKTLPPRQGQS